MRKLVLTFAVFCITIGLCAQETGAVDGLAAPEGYEYVDSVVVSTTSRVNETLFGKNIFDTLPKKYMGAKADVVVNQSAAIDSAMIVYVAANPKRLIKGYRVRIFFDNSQNARAKSEELLREFRTRYPLVPSYLGYQYPYFKVTVGDYRTKSKARKFLKSIVRNYPKAFLVQEDIEYPALDETAAMKFDTLKVLRPLSVETTFEEDKTE